MSSRSWPRAGESCQGQAGPKGASLGQAELSLKALGPVGARKARSPQAGEVEEVLALLWAPAWAVPRIWGRRILSGSSWLLLLLGCGGVGLF